MGKEQQLEKIAEKVKKLLALSESNNEAEAALAAAKASELLDKYGMTLSDVEIKTTEMSTVDIESEYTVPPQWYRNLWWFIPEYYYCKSLKGQKKFVDRNGAVKSKTIFHILGSKIDVEIATYVCMYLENAVKKIADKYIIKNYPLATAAEKNSARSTFCVGAVKAISDNIEKSREDEHSSAKTKSGSSLIVVKNSVVNQYSKEQFPKSITSTVSITWKSPNDYSHGYSEGSKISINPGINGSKQKQIK